MSIILTAIIALVGFIPIVLAMVILTPKILVVLTNRDPSEIIHLFANLLATPTLYVGLIISCIIWTFNVLYTSFGIPTKLYLEIREENSVTD